MKEATFKNLIHLEVPEDFVELNEEENKKFFTGDLSRISFRNKEKHILLSLSQSKVSFLYRLYGVKTALNGALNGMAKSLKDYEALGEQESVIFDQKALTAAFSFTAKDADVKQYGELSVFKIKNVFYAIYCVSKFEDKEESKEIFARFRSSLAPMKS